METRLVRPDQGSAPNRIRLACIDMAGTVINEDGTVLKAFHSALGAAGIEGPELDHAMGYALETMGLSKAVVFKHLLDSEERVDQALAAFVAAMDEAVENGEVSEIPGAAQVLADLRATGTTVCLTTGFSPEVQQAIIEHLVGVREVAVVGGHGQRPMERVPSGGVGGCGRPHRQSWPG
jgi:beta-phosphoglucomutase-like phosphatase (HAD superfamily)